MASSSSSSSDPHSPRPPSEELSNLRTQRTVIAEHLTWLDRMIANLEKAQTKGAGEVPEAEPPVPEPKPPPSRIVQTALEGKTDDAFHANPLLKEIASAERARVAGQQNARSIQTGCIIMGVIAVVAFLVTFFVIPYFIF